MNKRNLIIGIIVLMALVGGVVLWSQKSNQQDTKQQTKKEVDKQVQEQSTQEQNQKQEVNKEQKENQEQVINHLSPKEIEKLKKEKDLVWYEIPELGIKFLVTKDTKEDLDYFIKKSSLPYNIKHKYVYLFYKSLIRFNNEDWCGFKRKTKENNCSSIGIDIRKIADINAPADGCDYFVLIKNPIGLCISHPQAALFKNYHEYKEYLQSIKNKNFKIYFETVNYLN